VMDYVDRDLAVDEKMVVVSSGYGPIYPADIPIGIVSAVGEETINIYKEIEVQAFVDFRVLEEVMVLIVPENTTVPTFATTTTTGITITTGTSGTTGTTGTTLPGGVTTTTGSPTTTTTTLPGGTTTSNRSQER
jgi:hypothetical protein